MDEKLIPKIDFNEYSKDKYLLDLGKYEIKEENGKIFAVLKKHKYPKTYKACRSILDDYNISSVVGYKSSLLESLQDLLVRRDAYWKIAGEELGLNKPWKPNWISGRPFYCISVNGNIIVKGRWYTSNKILAFPTAEMRDAFLENFNGLIEQCKELL